MPNVLIGTQLIAAHQLTRKAIGNEQDAHIPKIVTFDASIVD